MDIIIKTYKIQKTEKKNPLKTKVDLKINNETTPLYKVNYLKVSANDTYE